MTTRSVRAAALLCTVAALFVALATRAEDEPKHPKRKTPLTTSKVTGSPEPPPKFKSVRAFANAKFDHPTLIARAPGGTRLFVGEQTGTLYSLSARTPSRTCSSTCGKSSANSSRATTRRASASCTGWCFTRSLRRIAPASCATPSPRRAK